ALHPALQIGAVAFAAILVGQDVFAVWRGGALGRGLNDAGQYRLSSRKHAGPQHRQAERVEMVRWLRRPLPRGRLIADVSDYSAYVLVAQFASVGVAHHDQPATVRIHAIADRAEYLPIRPGGE